MTPALAPQLGLLGSPSDPVGRFTMREGPSLSIVRQRESPLGGWVLTAANAAPGRPKQAQPLSPANGAAHYAKRQAWGQYSNAAPGRPKQAQPLSPANGAAHYAKRQAWGQYSNAAPGRPKQAQPLSPANGAAHYAKRQAWGQYPGQFRMAGCPTSFLLANTGPEISLKWSVSHMWCRRWAMR